MLQARQPHGIVWPLLGIAVLLGCRDASEPVVKDPAAWELRGAQIQKVVQAISKHYDEKNRFPSYVPLEKPFHARPNLSWRVWILPQLGQQELFDQFKPEENWDSEHNIKLIKKMPDIYLTAEGRDFAEREPGSTTIQSLSGDGAILDSERSGWPLSREAIRDGLTETALLIECHPSRAVLWTKPDDFAFDPSIEADVSRFGIDGEDFFVIVTVSGDPHRIRKDAEIKLIDRLFQRDDERETPWESLEYSEKSDAAQKSNDGGDANRDGSGDEGSENGAEDATKDANASTSAGE